MSLRHGFATRGLDVPRGVDPPTGRFGRMFPTFASQTGELAYSTVASSCVIA